MTVQTESPKSFVAGEALGAFRRVKLATRNAWLADAADYGIGVTQEGVAITKDVPVRLYGQGSCKMVASAAITAGARVYAAADGKVAATGTLTIGTALDTATANNSVIEVLPHVANLQSSSSSSSSSSST